MESEAQPDLVALAKPVLLEAVRQFCSGDISAEDFLDYREYSLQKQYNDRFN